MKAWLAALLPCRVINDLAITARGLTKLLDPLSDALHHVPFISGESKNAVPPNLVVSLVIRNDHFEGNTI